MAAEMCGECAAGPRDIRGHDRLALAVQGHRGVIYHCQVCHALWSREYLGGGAFGWTMVATPEPAENPR